MDYRIEDIYMLVLKHKGDIWQWDDEIWTDRWVSSWQKETTHYAIDDWYIREVSQNVWNWYGDG